MNKIIVFNLLILFFASSLCHGSQVGIRYILRRDLLNSYDIGRRPVHDSTQDVVVKFGMSLNSLHVDDMKQSMYITSWMIMTWRDDALRWDPEDYSNITTLRMGTTEIWSPAVTLYNSISGDVKADITSVPIMVSSEGLIQWVTPFVGEVSCDVNIKKWPSDIHTCSFEIGSWAHLSQDIKLESIYPQNVSLRLDNYQENSRWKLLKAVEDLSRRKTEPENITQIDFRFTVQRQANSDAICLLQSSLAMCLMVLCSYALPLHFLTARVLLHLFSLTLMVGSDLMVMLFLPPTGNTTPYIMAYYAGMIVLTTCSLVATIIFSGCLASTPHNVLVNTSCSFRDIWKCFTSPPVLMKDYFLVSGSGERLPLDPELQDESEVTVYEKGKEGSDDYPKIMRIINIALAICLTVIYFSLYLRMRGTILT